MFATQAKPVSGSRSALWRVAPVALAMVLTLLMVTRIPSALRGVSVLSGKSQVVATVERDGSVVTQDVALQMLTDLRPGDHVHLHVLGPTRGNAYVQTLHGNKWTTYFEEAISDDGLLPMTLDVGDGPKGQLQVLLCSGTHTAQALRGKPIPLDCTSTTTAF